MQEFNHPHVMPLIGVCLDTGPGVSMVMPFMANGSLLDYLKNERSSLVIREEPVKVSRLVNWRAKLRSPAILRMLCVSISQYTCCTKLIAANTCTWHHNVLGAGCEKTAASNVSSSCNWDGISHSTKVHPS